MERGYSIASGGGTRNVTKRKLATFSAVCLSVLALSGCSSSSQSAEADQCQPYRADVGALGFAIGPLFKSSEQMSETLADNRDQIAATSSVTAVPAVREALSEFAAAARAMQSDIRGVRRLQTEFGRRYAEQALAAGKEIEQVFEGVLDGSLTSAQWFARLGELTGPGMTSFSEGLDALAPSACFEADPDRGGLRLRSE